ncbi:hypothetical protein [Fundidesulfovibrio putealis]|uniref:hypothetical protein n=1 Tax=Fundidesulfovibrio putealis TaxID=270496 RepID=UPI0012EB4AA0|nr:hypothetical protein [Fundidesulfovibrio putealis]KAF0234873.1 MAG: hypothetical protein FD177_436 [Desulfovibrionaceae bacterium]
MLSIIGLILNTVGSILIAVYGLPISRVVSKDGRIIIPTLELPDETEYVELSRTNAKQYSTVRIGAISAIWLMVAGFVLQFVSAISDYFPAVQKLLDSLYPVDAWGFILTIQASGLLLWLFVRYAFKYSES